ncbi:MAG: hypothetical protein L7U72_09200 [Rubripirellula sp.]|nr:hypothetical protein [Rubripirellula sp.]
MNHFRNSYRSARIVMVLTLVLAPSSLQAMKVIKRGDSIGVFYVTKITGAESDGVKPGQRLCYRCRFGTRPMVMLFARQADERLDVVVRHLDRLVAENQESKLKGLVTLIGESQETLEREALGLLNRSGVKEIPLAVATEQGVRANQYQLPKEADVTIVIARDSRVLRTLVFDLDKLDFSVLDKELERLLK